MRGIALLGGFLVLVAAACGGAEDSPLLDGGTTNDDGGNGNDAIALDGTVLDGGGNCEVAKCATIPQGFRAVRLAGAKTTCPNGWASEDGVTDPQVTSDACSCACNVTQMPDCNSKGNITRFLDDTTTPTCGSQATTFLANGGGCTDIGNTLFLNHGHYSVTAPEPSGGACQYDAKADNSKVTSTATRLCAPPPSCQGAICDGGAICVATDGADAACPGDFPTKTVVGSSASATCGSCGSSCTTAGSCTGTLSFFTDLACTLGKIDFTADGVCTANTPSSTAYTAYEYAGSLAKAACSGTPPTSTPTASLDTPVTVCCK